MDEKINCTKCKHYYVTWDPAFPKGCRLFEFKSKQIPSVLVKQSTGEQCTSYVKKDK